MVQEQGNRSIESRLDSLEDFVGALNSTLNMLIKIIDPKGYAKAQSLCDDIQSGKIKTDKEMMERLGERGDEDD